ncbi:hypothetical protein [Cellulosimicrobium arenosum]|uniref:Integral membrane protein n=1 Tax=Cellulosimicrobium arenosum TaxID=2708133 RepID=A0A927PCM5_9MICO|nr:hypothetical protein [Cellulosimicrobium arenosum]MBD8079533.1 hypothetical protein [Cellulosimicrobium arenosum]
MNGSEETSRSGAGGGGLAERLAALEQENAELRRLVAERAPHVDEPQRPPRHRGRSAAAVVLLLVATLLAPVAAVSAWTERTLTDTERYVATVAPLAHDPVVRQAIAGRITHEVMERLDVAALVDQAIGELQSTLQEQGVAPRASAALPSLVAPLTSGVESFVRETANRLVNSDEFASTWAQANRVAHRQLVAVLRGSGGDVLQVGQDGQLTIQLAGVIDLLKERLVARGLDVAGNIPTVDASFTLAQTSQLVEVQNRYAQVVALGTWLPWVVLGLYAAGVLVAVRRARALVVAGLALTLAMLLLGVGLAVARALYLDALSGRVLRLDAAEVVFDQLLSFLRTTLRTVGVLGLVVALVAYLAGPGESARALRGAVVRGLARARAGAEQRGASSGRLGTWLGRHRRPARVVVLALAALVLLLAPHPTPPLVVGTAVVAGLLVAVLELVARPPQEVAGDDGPETATPDDRPGDRVLTRTT